MDEDDDGAGCGVVEAEEAGGAIRRFKRRDLRDFTSAWSSWRTAVCASLFLSNICE